MVTMVGRTVVVVALVLLELAGGGEGAPGLPPVGIGAVLVLPPSYTTLQSGLGGAIGSHYVEEESRLYFVEYNGKLSSYDVVPRVEGTGSLPSKTMAPETSLNLMDGTSAQGGHIRWDTALGYLAMRGQGNCRLAGLGKSVSYWAVTAAYLDTLTYGAAGSGLGASELEAGMTFGVKNYYRQPAADFDYAKVYVSNYQASGITVLVTTYKVQKRYVVHGTGYTNPEDIVVTSSREYAYVTERNGNFVRVRMSSANKDRGNAAAVSVVRSGLGALHQISLNDDETVAYVVEYGASGRLLGINTVTGATTTLRTGLAYAVGLVTRGDGKEAFISLQGGGGRIMRYSVDAGTTEYLPVVLPHLFFMTWADAGKQEFFVAQRTYNRVHRVAINSVTDATVQTLAGTVPNLPASVAVVSATDLIVCTDDYLVRKAYNTAYTGSGPLLLGIGHVPKTSIVGGYATTDPGYFFQVKDAPFGGQVHIMVNHQKARGLGARYYRVQFGGTTVDDSFSDYKWVGDKFALTSTEAYNGFFPVRRGEDLWYNPHLGAVVDTTKFPGGLRSVLVQFYSSPSTSSYISGAYDLVWVFVDNTRPTASIAAIHQVVNGVKTPIPACGIVEGTSDEFSFDLTVHDLDGNLLSWSLTTVWGDNKSGGIASDTYHPGHVTPSKKWYGGPLTTPAGNWHATVPGDPSSRRCARTFYLTVWDRAINGYTHIHRTVSTKSVTLLLS